MGRIRVLPGDLANQIAAGEVVERPASVIKELVENSIDAGAKHLSIAVEMGGKRLVRVEDDGEGMSAEDARLAVERHATSKIRSAEDLGGIATLGFRGEALPAIASVSHFVLRSRARGADSGTEVRINGGTVASVTEVGMAEGTSIEVSDLFYNLPARRKFLKSDGAESAQVSRLVTQLALCYPEIGFTLTSAGRKVVQCPPVASLRERFYQLYGERGDLVDVHRDSGEVKVVGYRRGARRAGANPRPPEHLRQPANRQGSHHRTRHHRCVQRRVDQGAEPGGALVHLDAADGARRERAPDESRSPVPRSVTRARGDTPNARRRSRARTCTGVAARASECPSGARDHPAAPDRLRRQLSQPMVPAGHMGSSRVDGLGNQPGRRAR